MLSAFPPGCSGPCLGNRFCPLPPTPTTFYPPICNSKPYREDQKLRDEKDPSSFGFPDTLKVWLCHFLAILMDKG